MEELRVERTDIGKITVELSILNKPTTLNEEEYEKIKLHPLIGYKILEPIDFDENVKLTVLQHHEKIDGSGYPNGRTGSDILIEARVLAVADALQSDQQPTPVRFYLGHGCRTLFSAGIFELDPLLAPEEIKGFSIGLNF